MGEGAGAAVKEKGIKMQVSSQELQIIRLLRKLKYGEVDLLIREGKPVEIQEVRQSLMLER